VLKNGAKVTDSAKTASYFRAVIKRSTVNADDDIVRDVTGDCFACDGKAETPALSQYSGGLPF